MSTLIKIKTGEWVKVAGVTNYEGGDIGNDAAVHINARLDGVDNAILSLRANDAKHDSLIGNITAMYNPFTFITTLDTDYEPEAKSEKPTESAPGFIKTMTDEQTQQSGKMLNVDHNTITRFYKKGISVKIKMPINIMCDYEDIWLRAYIHCGTSDNGSFKTVAGDFTHIHLGSNYGLSGLGFLNDKDVVYTELNEVECSSLKDFFGPTYTNNYIEVGLYAAAYSKNKVTNKVLIPAGKPVYVDVKLPASNSLYD